MKKIIVGFIANTHGIKGELKIKSETDFDRFSPGNTLYMDEKDQTIAFKIKRHRIHKDMDLVTFDGYEDINLVEKYKGNALYIHEDQLTDLEADEYYYSELIGVAVYDQHGTIIGEVSAIREVPQGEILEITTPVKKLVLIPFVDAFIKEVTEDKIIVETIEGLV